MTTTEFLRYRIVTRHDSGEEHVSAAVFSRDEAVEQIALDAALHEANGWYVARGPRGLGIYAISPNARREIFARSFTPHNDTPEGGDA